MATSPPHPLCFIVSIAPSTIYTSCCLFTCLFTCLFVASLSVGTESTGGQTVCFLDIPTPGEGNGNPLQYSFLENPMDGGAW